MTLQRDVTVGVGLLAGLALVVALSAVGLLVRMGPAIDTILQRNGRSLEAGEDLLRTLVLLEDDPASTLLRAELDAALVRMRQNVTEPEEEPIVAAIEVAAPKAREGDRAARAETARAVGRLGEVNRAAMSRADEEARRLSRGGAWAVVFLGLTALIGGIGVSRRLRHQAVEPLRDLDDAVDAHAHGAVQRRARSLDACDELRRLAQNFNHILDVSATPRPSTASQVTPDHERAVLIQLLDAQAETMIVAGAEGEILAANQQALSRLAEAGGNKLRAALRRAVAEAIAARRSDPPGDASPPEPAAAEPDEPSIRVTEVPTVNRWICVVEPA